jgi:hypothetical protein
MRVTSLVRLVTEVPRGADDRQDLARRYDLLGNKKSVM